MKTKLIELIDFEKVDTLLEGFNKSTGFVTAILDLKGKVLSKSGWRQICTDFHRINPETSKNCTTSDTELAGKLAGGEKYHFYKCLNGLVDVAVPIVINGEHIANLFSGQFFFEEPDRMFFKKQAGKYGFNEKNYLEALGNVPVVSKEKVQVAMDFLLNMTQLISETIFQKLEQAELNKALKESEERFQLLFNKAPLGYQSLDFDGNFIEVNQQWLDTLGYEREEIIGKWFGDFLTPVFKDGFRKRFPIFKAQGQIHSEFEMVHKNGSVLFIAFDGRIGYDLKGDFKQTHCILQDITERKQAEQELKRIEWLLTSRPPVPEAQKHAYIPPYGDLISLNTSRLILDSVGEQILTDIAGDYLNMLDTSTAVYEKNGDYALGIFSSGWCRFMDAASRAICDTTDNRKALDCGRWHCHESCWSRASKTAIETGQPTDIECDGGIRLYAVPILVRDEIIGAINVGYGEPPRDEKKLRELATYYKVSYEELRAHAMNYESRPPYIVELAKHRLMASARMIGEITERKQAEIALAESEENLSITLRSIGDGVISTDINGLIVNMNPIAEELCGWKLTDASGKPLPEVFKIMNDITRETVADPVKKVLENGEIVGLANHTVLISRNGTEYLIADSAAPIKNKKGAIKGVVLVFSNVTEKYAAQVALKESEQRFKSLIENAPDGVVIIDEKGKFTYGSPNAARHFGYTENEIIGHFGHEFTHPEDLPLVMNALETIMYDPTQKPKVKYRFKNKNGEFRWIETTFTNLLSEKAINGIVLNFSDITERKKMLEELVTAKEKAEESDHLKSAFLANMSHEIRTPMNGILGFADLLKDAKLTGEEKAKYIGIIEKSGARLLNIINDIVDISKIEAGLMTLDMMETNVNEQIEYIFTFFKPEVEAKGMKFSLSAPLMAKEATITTDREKLYAILTNLVKNAIKYSKEGEIEIGYKIVETQYIASLQFYVKDTGMGIPKDRHEAIFERFIQADITNKMANQGAGLGLSITRAYVEMLSGKIWVESEEGIGSTFYFTLPYIAEPQGKSIVKNSITVIEDGNMVKKLKILIAEDDEASSQLISIYVRKFRNEIINVQNGREAVEACRNNPDIDLILMDIQMPEMNGYEATRQIRQFNTEVIIIALTAFALAGDREKALEAGCNDYISKPITKDELHKLINKYFSYLKN